MYIPPHFREDRVPVLHEAMREIAFATLVTQGEDGIAANHLPLLLDAGQGVLRGHVARANPVWRSLTPEHAALAIFLGPNAYVSPSWYPAKAESGKVVPTWNYLTVHAHGRITVIEDAAWLRDHVGALTRAHEQNRAEPWAVEDAPDGYVAGLLRAIIGLQFTIDRLEGKWKMSQNRPAADREGVCAGLEDHPLSRLMGG